MTSAPLKVLFVTDAPAVGGSEVYMREVIPAMRPHGIEAAVAMPAAAGTADFRDQLRQRAIPVYAYRTLAEIAPLERDSSLTVLSSWNAWGYRKYYRTLRGPFVSLVHDQLMLHVPLVPQAIYRQLYEIAQASDIRGAPHVITVSHWGAAYLQRHHRMSEVHAVPNGVDVTKFRPAVDEERAQLRRQYHFSNFTVLNVARMSLEKNHLSVLAVARAVPELDFALVGSGYLEALLRASAPPNVHFLGKRHDVPQLYRAADVALQPTIAENQSLATLEALASGLPVVTNDIPAQRELIEFGREGLLVQSGVAGYATALRVLASHPKPLARMREHARERVLRGHTLEQNAAGLAQVLHEIAAKERTKSYDLEQ